MWVALALISATCLGFYDVMKKLSVRGNDVLTVLMLNTVFGAVLMSPILVGGIATGECSISSPAAYGMIIIKSFIVLGSWILGYFAVKHLPLTIQGPINASRPVMVLVGAVAVYGEQLNLLQWAGISLGFLSLYMISRISASEGISLRSSRWLWMAVGAALLGAVSALYDKYLLRHFRPLDVQAWYSFYQCIIMSCALMAVRRWSSSSHSVFSWRWTIPLISIFLTVADIAYFYSLSLDGAMISVVSMIRRGSVVIPFIYGAVMLREKNFKAKAADLCILMVSLGLLVLGSTVAK
ncbi:DMT family transporter [Paramuribaculum intestinale]|jgi:transporter family protein|uniref:DMT family transporter n=1 Tax=Paramuribaculum intestinale TaxID=2094151 RepID=UPI0025B0B7E6|nr:DMT family transporter [Paramuribaculum intestinale]